MINIFFYLLCRPPGMDCCVKYEPSLIAAGFIFFLMRVKTNLHWISAGTHDALLCKCHVKPWMAAILLTCAGVYLLQHVCTFPLHVLFVAQVSLWCHTTYFWLLYFDVLWRSMWIKVCCWHPLSVSSASFMVNVQIRRYQKWLISWKVTSLLIRHLKKTHIWSHTHLFHQSKPAFRISKMFRRRYLGCALDRLIHHFKFINISLFLLF